MSHISFNLFCLGDKKLLSGFLGNEVDFRDIMCVSPNILAKNLNLKKLRHGFVDERAMITTRLISSCHCKTLVPVCLGRAWKHVFNTNSELSQNRIEKQIATVNWLCNDI